MSKLNRIKLEDKEKVVKIKPLLVFFDSLPDSDFIKYVDLLTQGIGIGIEGVTGCTFPNNLDEYQVVVEGEGFDGVQFTYFEDSVEVDVPTFRKFLRIACEDYWTEYPESRLRLEEYLARPQPPLEEGTTDEWKRKQKEGEFAMPISDI